MFRSFSFAYLQKYFDIPSALYCRPCPSSYLHLFVFSFTRSTSSRAASRESIRILGFVSTQQSAIRRYWPEPVV
nr:hypothetical protein Iba_chr12aCG7420 [Ipomoea batatas]